MKIYSKVFLLILFALQQQQAAATASEIKMLPAIEYVALFISLAFACCARHAFSANSLRLYCISTAYAAYFITLKYCTMIQFYDLASPLLVIAVVLFFLFR